MRNNPSESIPDENKIEQLLRGFKPEPTLRFYARMSSAPWQVQDHSRSSSQTLTRTVYWKPILVLACSILALVILGLSFIPSVRVAADQFIHFFLPASSDRLEVQITPENMEDYLDFSNPSNFPLNIAEAQQLAGFMVKQIPSSTYAPTFIGARFDTKLNNVIVLYKAEDYILLLTQRLLGNSQDVFSIGSNANVQFVNVGDIQAEYVIGGWKAVSTQTPMSTLTPTGPVHISAFWDNSLPQYTLRWQVAGFVYELRSIGENSPSQSQLISWANELK